jgi:CheY-like chemotaxis protein
VAPVAYRILVVEDEVDTRELLDFTLRWNGHEVAPRIVFVTAAPPDNAFRAQYGGRPVPVLAKPYTPERLLQMIKRGVARDV